MISPTPRARKRRQSKFARCFLGPFPDYSHRDYIVQQPCAGCGRHGCEPAHAISRKMGGWDGDWSVLVALCPGCHYVYDNKYANSPEVFKRQTGVDLLAYAETFARYALNRAIEREPERREEFEAAFAESWIGRRA